MKSEFRSLGFQWSAWGSITSVLVRAGSGSAPHLQVRRDEIFIQATAKSAAVVTGEHLKMFPFCSDGSGGFAWVLLSHQLGEYQAYM